MLARLGAVLCVVALFYGAGANATETWRCEGSSAQFSPMDLKLDGDWLVRDIEYPVVGRDGLPIPVSGQEGKYQTEIMPMKFRVLQNNDIGIIAAWSESVLDRHGKALLGSEVIVISKPSGDTRIGSVLPNGALDLMIGHCALKKDASKSDTDFGELGH